MTNMIRNHQFAFQMMDKRKRYFFLATIHVLLGVTLPFGMAFIPKLVILMEVISSLSFFLSILFVAMMVLLQWCDQNCQLCCDRDIMVFRYTLGSKLMKQAFLRDIKEIDSPQGKKRADLARRAIYEGNYVGIEIYLRSLREGLLGLFALIVELIVIFRSCWYLAVLVMCTSVLIIFLNKREYNKVDDIEEQLGDHFYALRRLYASTLDDEMQNDIWLYGMKSLFSRKYSYYKNCINALEKKVEGRFNKCTIQEGVGLFVRDLVVCLVLITQIHRQEMTIAEFVFILLIIENFEKWMEDLTDNIQEIVRNDYLISAVREFFRPEQETQCPKTMDFRTALEFQDVSFSYDDEENKVIDHMSFLIRRGEKIAITGLNGAGKSTLIKLLSGAYQPLEGKVLCDGNDISTYNWEDYKELFSVMNQNSCLLPFSVTENITGKEDQDIDQTKLDDAINLAGVKDLIAALPQGMNSSLTQNIDTNGVSLSGGEEQKVLMARAIYADRQILVFDEPTASLDAAAEEKMYLHLSEIAKDKTCIFISHRLISTKFCDRIFFLDHGTISEQGTHMELMAKNGQYADLFTQQGKRYNEAEC